MKYATIVFSIGTLCATAGTITNAPTGTTVTILIFTAVITLSLIGKATR